MSLLFDILAELAAERLVHQGVDGLCDADDAGEDDAPAVAVEAVGGGDGYGVEQDAHAEGCQAHVGGGDVLLERLHERGRDESDDTGGEGGRCGNIHKCSPWLVGFRYGKRGLRRDAEGRRDGSATV